MVVGLHHFDVEQDPDPHLSELSDLDPLHIFSGSASQAVCTGVPVYLLPNILGYLVYFLKKSIFAGTGPPVVGSTKPNIKTANIKPGTVPTYHTVHSD